MPDARRSIPSIERLLASAELQDVLARAVRSRVVDALRAIQDEVRAGRLDVPSSPAWYASEVSARLDRAEQSSLRNVINATGIVLHTNLGRAPLADCAVAAMNHVAAAYSNLEYDLAAGKRGSRYAHCVQLLRSLTGSEAALVVNNNAAAVVLALNTVALGRAVLVSRGELVEIGDSFRIAEIIERSGARVHEVGATNRTHRKDYESALPEAAAILKVHPSNYQTSGFVSSVAVSELAAVARNAKLPLLYDLGSGLIESLQDLGLPQEPTVAEALASGADLVTMSGDKLLGGPQAGIMVGRADLVSAMQRNPLCRALRVDKLTLAALEATLQCYARGTARNEIPLLRMLGAKAAVLQPRAERIAALLRDAGIKARAVSGSSAVGGGAYPGVELPSFVVELETDGGANATEQRLRLGEPPVIARIAAERVRLDMRTVLPAEEAVLVARIRDACQ